MSHPAESPTLIIFDIDGTLIDATEIDNDSFDFAFREVTGVNLTASIWSQFKEVTAQAIVHQALGDAWPDIASTIDLVKESFLANLRAGHALNPASVRAFDDSVRLISSLRESPSFKVAIATGCWRETAHFKLKAAGFDVSDIPFACASDCYSRSEIISLAAQRAGIPVDRAVYVGDGIWDFRATQQLGIPFIGVGRKAKSGSEKDLSARERQIMDIIYRRGQASVAEVIEELPEAPSYSTVRTFMGILEKKGHLSHKEEDTRYIYLPTVPQAKARSSALERLVKTFFNNSVYDTVLALLELKENQDPEAMARLARLIEKAKMEKKS